jgi:type VI secretion system secreted protein Hcp
MPIYMNYDNLAIKGGVTEEGHTDWIELMSFQMGVGRGISAPTGNTADRESSAPSVSEITVTKLQDQATPKLLNEALQGEGKTVIIDFTKDDKGKLEVYMTYTLTNTMISGYSVNGDGNGRPSESLSLNFTEIDYKNTPNKPDGTPGSPETVGYHLGKAKVK